MEGKDARRRKTRALAFVLFHEAVSFLPGCPTQRLVKLSQANAKLSTESTGAKARLVEAEEMVERRGEEVEVSGSKV